MRTVRAFDDSGLAHLGGYVSGGDAATWYPELWTWLVKEVGVSSVIDVGCGDGVALDYFEHLGVRRRLGVEGTKQKKAAIIQHDYTEGPFVPVEPLFDLCWSCEFVEHVEEQYIPNYLATFEHADLLLMTHAEPGQDGYHHVHLRTRRYWIDLLEDAGFQYEEHLTVLTRALASANPSPWNHYRRSGLAFRRAV